jgi:Holliday junction DNA helicase RuvB
MFDEALAFIFGMGDLIWGKKKDTDKDLISEEKDKEIYHSNQVKPMTYQFRPQNLEQYIGQDRAKELVRLNLQKIMTTKFVHFIISGTQGTGKSTLAYILANHLDFKIHTYIGGSFTMENLKDFLIENEEGGNHILFIDEIHSLPKEMAEFMYPLLEDYLLPLGDIKVRAFIFVGATTEKNTLQKKFSPLVDRCGCQINLEHYQKEDIKLILKQYNSQTYKADVPEEIYDILSVNTRFNPRNSISLFDDYMVCKNINQVLQAHRIVKNSLTTDDILILEHLQEINKPVGVETLAIIIQQTRQDYQALLEPFLIQQGYISRTARGRVITEKAKLFLQEIK